MCWICEGWRNLGDEATAHDMAAWALERGVDVSVDEQGDMIVTLHPVATEPVRRQGTTTKRAHKKRRRRH
jgi:hypothetical protein